MPYSGKIVAVTIGSGLFQNLNQHRETLDLLSKDIGVSSCSPERKDDLFADDTDDLILSRPIHRTALLVLVCPSS